MKKLTFKRGVHPNDNKLFTSRAPIRKIAPATEMFFPLQQHIGAALTPLVKKGDAVLVGQKIADSDAPVSVPLHSSVSGVVKSVGDYLHPTGFRVPTIVIENDGQDTPAPPIAAKPVEEMTNEEIVSVIREAGIVGMGGAGFPTHVKLSPPKGKSITHVIVNGAECEPYLTSDHRVMLETPDEVIGGLNIVMRLFPQAKAYIAIEENKPDAIETMLHCSGRHDEITVLTLKKKYPQGGEKQLIYAVTGREVPSGALPADIGCVVLNIDTVTAIYRAVTEGKPLVRRIVTVSGDCVKEPGNFFVQLGTPFRAVIEAAGGMKEEPKKILMGGPMMGVASYSLDVPVVKGTSAILLFSEKQATVLPESPCIRCGKCGEVCPMNLRPSFLNAYYLNHNLSGCVDENIRDCIECGCCSYVCPAKRHLVQSIRAGKQQISQMKLN